MWYHSTRGEAPRRGFEDVLLAGLAPDGGLYVPEVWPRLEPEVLARFAGRPYAEVAGAILALFAGRDADALEVEAVCREAYAGFRHPAVCPLVQLGPGDFLLELFHGPTLAFKDVAMQVLARLMDRALQRRGTRVTIVGATSGDTGAAAIEAFGAAERADVIILFPHGRVSEVQRLQMTTPQAEHVHAVAIEGTFDDCQALVKAMFAHRAFADRVQLAGVNSINWVRILAQSVYYVMAGLALGAPHRPVSFVVPTGNFGNIFAGHVAERLGLPIERLVIATNANDILARTLATGRYEVRGVVPTSSPSMDIEVSSNFERLLFEAGGGDPQPVRQAMAALRQSGAFTIAPATLAAIRARFSAVAADEAAIAASLKGLSEPDPAFGGYLADPHTATALHAARRLPTTGSPRVLLATAHPAKFPDAVAAATGHRPALPPWRHLDGKPERVTRLPADQAVVERFILARSRAAQGIAA